MENIWEPGDINTSSLDCSREMEVHRGFYFAVNSKPEEGFFVVSPLFFSEPWFANTYSDSQICSTVC